MKLVQNCPFIEKCANQTWREYNKSANRGRVRGGSGSFWNGNKIEASCLSEQTGNPLAIQFLQRLQVHQEAERLKYRNISQETASNITP